MCACDDRTIILSLFFFVVFLGKVLQKLYPAPAQLKLQTVVYPPSAEVESVANQTCVIAKSIKPVIGNGKMNQSVIHITYICSIYTHSILQIQIAALTALRTHSSNVLHLFVIPSVAFIFHHAYFFYR